MKNTMRFLLGIALSIFFLWLTFKQVDWPVVLQTLKDIQWPYVVLHTLAIIISQICRTLRWDLLIRPFVSISRFASFRISNLGNLLIMLLPLRLGELARPYLLKKEAGASLASSIGAVAVERVLDGLLVTLLFFLTTSQLDARYEVPETLRIGAFVSLAIFGVALVIITATLLTHGVASHMLRQRLSPIAPKLVDKAVDLLDAFVSGLRGLPNKRTIFALFAWTLCYWATNAIALFWLMSAFGWHLPMIAGFTIICVLVIGIMIPAGPGFLGTYQAALIAGLGIFHIDHNAAVAYSMIAYPVNLLVLVGLSLPSLVSGNFVRVDELMHTEPTSAK